MEEQTTQGIDLSVFLHNFRRTLQHFFWVPIVLGLLLGGMSWLRAARSYAPVYQSSAVFSVSAGFSSSTDILSHSTYLDSNAAAQLSATFPYVLQSDRMQLLLQQELGDQRAPVSLSASSVADAALFTAQMRFEICVINITTVILLRRGIHCDSFLSFRSVGTPLVFDWLTEGIVVLGVCRRGFPAEHGTSHHCRFLRFGHVIGSIQSSCTFFWGSVLRVYIRG